MEKARRDPSWREEELNKESVYTELEQRISVAKANVKSSKEYVDSGAYEEQDRSLAYAPMARAEKELSAEIRLFQILNESPYFAHIAFTGETDANPTHCFMSDCEELDSVVDISQHEDTYLVPFKLDRSRPIWSELYHVYQARTPGFTVKGIPYRLDVIRDVEIERRKLKNVNTLYSLGSETDEKQTQELVDEFLQLKLEENRDSAILRNIISTLQSKQFEIVQTGEDESFVVQGCAGSGKTQCLIHRLFFLRDVLRDDIGWNKVLLITPTKLFRKYSEDLMKRYRLTDIRNTSLAEWYLSLLYQYDDRFRERHYSIELSEEYLPDDYLREIYDSERIQSIVSEIKKAITSYVHDGCTLLGEDDPERITKAEINALHDRVSDEIRRLSIIEMDQREDEELSFHRKSFETAEKRVKALRKQEAELTDTQLSLRQRREKYNALIDAIKTAEDEKRVWELDHLSELDALYSYTEDVYASIPKLTIKSQLLAASQYAMHMHAYLDASTPEGNANKKANEELSILAELIELSKTDLAVFLGKQTQNAWNATQLRQENANAQKLENVSAELEIAIREMEEHDTWLREHLSEQERDAAAIKNRRSALERVRYFLRSIESSVFEREVWSVLTPIKEKYGISAVLTSRTDDGRQRLTRILHKVDLLLYLRIYAEISPRASLPECRLICIDEGQDLHPADFDLIRLMYPQIVFNVFGDTTQALHASCGIQNWIKDTGITSVFEMMRNYRNTAAIVEFCNLHFNTGMLALGQPLAKDRPKELRNAADIRKLLKNEKLVVIVKDQDEYLSFCEASGEEPEFLDTNAVEQKGDKISCYTVFAAKGLEFPSVLVWAHGMSVNQRVVACTRALKSLYYYEGGTD